MTRSSVGFPRFAVVVVAASGFIAVPATAGATSSSTQAVVKGFRVYTGYADCPAEPTGCGGSTITNPNYPSPWYGATGVTFEADPNVVDVTKDGDPDTSAIRVDNTSKTDLVIQDVSVTGCGSHPLDLWGTSPYAYPYTVPAGGKIVFSSTSGDNFDGSDICNPGVTVNVEVGGKTYSFLDNTAEGGRGALAGTGGDETVPWSLVGGTKDRIYVTPSKLPQGVVGTPYNQGFAAQDSNGAPTFTLNGSLPPGLSLSAGTYSAEATISGTPTKAGKYQFSVTISDASGDSGTANFTLRVSPDRAGVTSRRTGPCRPPTQACP